MFIHVCVCPYVSSQWCCSIIDVRVTKEILQVMPLPSSNSNLIIGLSASRLSEMGSADPRPIKLRKPTGWKGEDDALIGSVDNSPIACRPRISHDARMYCFINHLVLEVLILTCLRWLVRFADWKHQIEKPIGHTFGLNLRASEKILA